MRLVLCVVGVLLICAVPGSAMAFRMVASPGELVFSTTFSGDREIFTSAADGSSRVDVSNDPHADITPAWSRDGKQIAFASNRSGSFEIYVMNTDGSGVVQVTRDHAYDDHPHFTGYDKALVYESTSGGNWEIRRIAVDGSGEVDLTQNKAADRYPATAPRGAIAFASKRGGAGWHVWVMRANGTHALQLTRQPGGQSQPSWDPSGARIAYVAGTPGQGTSIWSVLRNGTKAQKLAAASGRDESSPAWSPDSASIVYQDCSVGTLTDCGLETVVPGSPSVDISTLRAPYLDTFNGGDSRFWQVITNGTGATNTEQNGQLVTTVAANSAEGGPYNEFETHWGTLCRLSGDYDVQADYRMLEWPAANGVQAALSAFAGPSNIGFMAIRESQVWGEQYSSWIPQDFVSAATADPAGTLRLQRQGNTAQTSYWNGSSWVVLASGPTITDPATITLGAGSNTERFIHQEVKIAWDNFRINAGTISCPTWWEDDSPDWQAGSA
jgi:dipeptidyl aminopeptidase/acylaminoacyl peptidase